MNIFREQILEINYNYLKMSLKYFWHKFCSLFNEVFSLCNHEREKAISSSDNNSSIVLVLVKQGSRLEIFLLP